MSTPSENGSAAPPASAGIAEVRDYWNRRPCNIRHGTAEVGTREYFDQVEQRKYFVEPHIPGFAEFERWRGKKVLEVGCGIGTDSISFARAGADLTVVELSDASLELCKKRFEVYGLKARFFSGNAEKLSETVPVEPYDLVYSFGVLHHTPHPPAAFAEIRRYMNASSELRVMLYSKRSSKNLAIGLGLAQPEAQAGCPIAFTYTAREIRAMLEPLGYRVNSVGKDHIFPYVIEKYVKYEYERRWHWRWMPGFLFRGFERALGWHMLVVASLPGGAPASGSA